MTKAYGYIYTIFGLEASLAGYPGKPFNKACPELASEDHCLRSLAACA
jgi:hypothetical protein